MVVYPCFSGQYTIEKLASMFLDYSNIGIFILSGNKEKPDAKAADKKKENQPTEVKKVLTI